MKRSSVKARHYYFLNRRKCTDLQSFNRHSISDPKKEQRKKTDDDLSHFRAQIYKDALQEFQLFITEGEGNTYY
jgi:hypothetical protein